MSSLNFAYAHQEINFSIKSSLIRASTITIDFLDTSSSRASSNISELVRELESKSVATTLPLTNSQKIQALTNKKDMYIQERNEIMDSLLKIYLPWNRKKLRDIDLEIDRIDIALYEFEIEDRIKISEINKIIQSTEKKLAEQSLLLHEFLEKKQIQPFRPSL